MLYFFTGVICGSVIGAILMFVILGGDNDDLN